MATGQGHAWAGRATNLKRVKLMYGDIPNVCALRTALLRYLPVCCLAGCHIELTAKLRGYACECTRACARVQGAVLDEIYKMLQNICFEGIVCTMNDCRDTSNSSRGSTDEAVNHGRYPLRRTLVQEGNIFSRGHIILPAWVHLKPCSVKC